MSPFMFSFIQTNRLNEYHSIHRQGKVYVGNLELTCLTLLRFLLVGNFPAIM